MSAVESMHMAAYVSAGGALLAALCALPAAAGRRGSQPRAEAHVRRRRPLVSVCHVAAISFTIIAAVILLVLMAMRLILYILEIGHGGPIAMSNSIGFGSGGLAAIAALIVACALLLRSIPPPGRLRLVTPLFWLATLMMFWAALLIPPFVPTSGGASLVRSASSVALSLGLAITLCAFVSAQGLLWRRLRRRALLADPQPSVAADPPGWPGFRLSAGAVGLILIFLSCYHFAAPVEIAPGGYRLTALSMTVVSAMGGAALFALVGRRWNEDLADAAMGLVSMAPCSAAIALLPATPASLSDRYPLIFNAVVIALAVMTSIWIWLARVWHQQLDPDAAGRPWTTAGRLVRPAGRFGFFTAAIALLVAFLMSIWPCIPTVAGSDDSLGRFVAGLGGYLMLTLILIRGARLTHRGSLSALSVLSILGMVGFIVVRLLPYASADR